MGGSGGAAQGAGTRVGRWLLNLLLLGASVLATVVAVELGLRLIAPVPHPYRVDGSDQGDYVFSELRQATLNRYVPYRYGETSRTVRPDPEIMHGLSSELTFSVDRFGFRGARDVGLEKPPGTTRIVAIGGSTTECKDLDDAEAWPALLGASLAAERPGTEVLNAGFSGDTSRDHIALLAQHTVAFAPDAVLFLVGINDLDLQMKPDYSPLRDDQRSQFQQEPPAPGLLAKVWGSDLSHLIRLGVWGIRSTMTTDERGNPVQDLRGGWMADRRKQLQALPPREIDPTRWPSPEYEQNVRTLVGVTRAHGALPVLITQPVIWGAPPGDWEKLLWVAPDPDHRIAHGQLWEVLERFNDVLRRVAAEQDLVLVDLARQLPKTTEVFYDDDHYTIEGARQVAAIVASELARQDWTVRVDATKR